VVPVVTGLVVLCGLLAQEPAASRGSVAGQVVDALGAPVPLAEVWVTPWLGDEVLARTQADGSGVFAIGRLPEGDILSVHATADGKTIGINYHVRPRPAASAWVRLWDAGAVRGRVVDPDGKPLAGAEVLAAYDRARVLAAFAVRSTSTDEKGCFELTKVPLGEIDVRAVAPGYVLGSARVVVRDRAELDLVLQQGDGVRLAIRVTGAAAGELRGARVSLDARSASSLVSLPRSLHERRLESDGTLSLVGLPPALDYTISIRDDGFVFQPPDHRIEKATDVHEVTFAALRPETTILRGTLRGLQGEPLPRQTVVLRAANGFREGVATTGEDGGFEIASPLAPGEHFIAFLRRSDWTIAQSKAATRYGWDKRFWNQYEGVVDPEVPIELHAEPAITVRGRIVDREGQAIRFAPVVVEYELSDSRWTQLAWWQTSDREGRFEYQGLRALDDRVRVMVAGRSGAGTSDPLQLEVGKTCEVELRLDPAAIVEGTVRDARGTPIPGARVWLRNWDFARGRQADGSVEEVLTDRNGRYRHVGVTPGGHYLQLHFGEHEPAADVEPFEVAPGERVERDVELPGR
jgi:hypothetical protein